MGRTWFILMGGMSGIGLGSGLFTLGILTGRADLVISGLGSAACGVLMMSRWRRRSPTQGLGGQ